MKSRDELKKILDFIFNIEDVKAEIFKILLVLLDPNTKVEKIRSQILQYGSDEIRKIISRQTKFSVEDYYPEIDEIIRQTISSLIGKPRYLKTKIWLQFLQEYLRLNWFEGGKTHVRATTLTILHFQKFTESYVKKFHINTKNLIDTIYTYCMIFYENIAENSVKKCRDLKSQQKWVLGSFVLAMFPLFFSLNASPLLTVPSFLVACIVCFYILRYKYNHIIRGDGNVWSYNFVRLNREHGQLQFYEFIDKTNNPRNSETKIAYIPPFQQDVENNFQFSHDSPSDRQEPSQSKSKKKNTPLTSDEKDYRQLRTSEDFDSISCNPRILSSSPIFQWSAELIDGNEKHFISSESTDCVQEMISIDGRYPPFRFFAFFNKQKVTKTVGENSKEYHSYYKFWKEGLIIRPMGHSGFKKLPVPWRVNIDGKLEFFSWEIKHRQQSYWLLGQEADTVYDSNGNPHTLINFHYHMDKGPGK